MNENKNPTEIIEEIEINPIYKPEHIEPETTKKSKKKSFFKRKTKRRNNETRENEVEAPKDFATEHDRSAIIDIANDFEQNKNLNKDDDYLTPTDVQYSLQTEDKSVKWEPMRADYQNGARIESESSKTETVNQKQLNNKRSLVRASTVLNGILIFGLILGVILSALWAFSVILAVIGPILLGLSIFGLLGKVFLTLFYQPDPLPRLKPYATHIFDKIYGKTPKPPPSADELKGTL